MYLPRTPDSVISVSCFRSLSDTKKGVGAVSCAYPGNRGLRIASTIRISNYRPTPARISECRTDGLPNGDVAI